MPLDRTIEGRQSFAEGRDFGTAAAPARKGRNHRAFERAVQRVDGQPAFAIGKAERTARADDGAHAANGIDQREIFRPEAAAIGQVDFDGDMRRLRRLGFHFHVLCGILSLSKETALAREPLQSLSGNSKYALIYGTTDGKRFHLLNPPAYSRPFQLPALVKLRCGKSEHAATDTGQ